MYSGLGGIDVLFEECVLCLSTGLLLPQLPWQPRVLLLLLACAHGSPVADARVFHCRTQGREV